MNSRRFRTSPPSSTTPRHPAEPFLRTAGLHFDYTDEPSILLLPFRFEQHTVRGILDHVRSDGLMVFHLSLGHCPGDRRAFHEAARLCNFLNEHLVAGRFALDVLDGELTYRNGHFFGSTLEPRSFQNFFDCSLAAVQPACRAFGVVCAGGDAAQAMAVVLPPSAS